MREVYRKILNKKPFMNNKYYFWLKLLLNSKRLKLLDSIVPNDKKIADLGCGSGIFDLFLYYSNTKREILGIDHDKKRIRIAQEASQDIKNLSFACGNINNLEINNYYDCFLACDFFHHLKFSDREKLIEKISQKINNDGLIIICDVEKKFSYKYFLSYLSDIILYGEKSYFFTEKEIEKLFRKYGLSKINTYRNLSKILAGVIYVFKYQNP